MTEPLNPFLQDSFKYEEEKLIDRLQDNYKEMATAINKKDIGTYSTFELRNGQEWQVGQNKHGILRKVIEVGPLPNATTKLIAHNIPLTSSTRFVRIYGVANDPSANSYLPLPFASTILSGMISLFVNGSNIQIATGLNRTNYTDNYVILEYWQS